MFEGHEDISVSSDSPLEVRVPPTGIAVKRLRVELDFLNYNFFFSGGLLYRAEPQNWITKCKNAKLSKFIKGTEFINKRVHNFP